MILSPLAPFRKFVSRARYQKVSKAAVVAVGARGRMDGIRHSKLRRIMIAGEILGLLRRSETHSNRERSERTTTEAAEEPSAPPARKNHWSEN